MPSSSFVGVTQRDIMTETLDQTKAPLPLAANHSSATKKETQTNENTKLIKKRRAGYENMREGNGDEKKSRGENTRNAST